MKSKKVCMLLVGPIVALVICPAFAIEVYKSQDVQPYSGKTANVHKSQQVQPYTSKANEVYKSQEIRPYMSGEIDVYKAAVKDEHKGAGYSDPVSEPLGEQQKAVSGNKKTIRTPTGRLGSNSDSQGGTPVASSVLGTWHGTASTIGTIILKSDGTYEYAGTSGGSYTLENGGITFKGKLAVWNSGHATLKNGNLEFTWVTAEGAHQWFSFAK